VTAPSNRLFYGDNLDVLRQHIADESVDLVDPIFNSNALVTASCSPNATPRKQRARLD
jgi:hypothetical protein